MKRWGYDMLSGRHDLRPDEIDLLVGCLAAVEHAVGRRLPAMEIVRARAHRLLQRTRESESMEWPLATTVRPPAWSSASRPVARVASPYRTPFGEDLHFQDNVRPSKFRRGIAGYNQGDVETEHFLGDLWRPVNQRRSPRLLESGVHSCKQGEGPPASEPDPTGKGPHPLIERGSSPRRSRRPSVGFAQRCLNNFLNQLLRGTHACAVQTAEARQFIYRNVAVLRQNRQLPLSVDCRFGPNTQRATKMFQACEGLDRDGIIGRETWSRLERFATALVNPPDTTTCGVPLRRATQMEQELDAELIALGRTARRRGVRARLSLFQNSSTTSHRNHFHCQASRTARKLAAFADPRTDRCTPRQIGATKYDTGADIVAAIVAVHACLGRRVEIIHVFSHSGSHGIFGTTLGTSGLYVNIDAESRRDGGREVADVPTSALAEDVVIVLHGCNLAAGTDNFAHALYQHLARSLRNPRVFGHYNGGCAGRDNSWREYSNRFPLGRRRSSIAPHYSGDGCCSAT